MVWYHRLIGETEGPPLITATACTATYCRLPSWHTDDCPDIHRRERPCDCPACRLLRRQDPRGRQVGQLAGRVADPVQADDQWQDRQDTGPEDSAIAADQRQTCDRIKLHAMDTAMVRGYRRETFGASYSSAKHNAGYRFNFSARHTQDTWPPFYRRSPHASIPRQPRFRRSGNQPTRMPRAALPVLRAAPPACFAD